MDDVQYISHPPYFSLMIHILCLNFVFGLTNTMHGNKLDCNWYILRKFLEGVVYFSYDALGKNNQTWVVIQFVHVANTLTNVALKIFLNLYFPNCMQIHAEILAKEDRQIHDKTGDWCANSTHFPPSHTFYFNSFLSTRVILLDFVHS